MKRISIAANRFQCRLLLNAGELAGSRRSGVAVLLVLAVLSITLGIGYALSRRSVTSSSLSVHEIGGLQARSAAGASVAVPLQNLQNDANWLPDASPSAGSFSPNEHHQVTVELADSGQGRRLDASAQIYDMNSSTFANHSSTLPSSLMSDLRPIADQRLRIRLTKQTRNDLPTAAITAFDSTVNQGNDAPIYIANGNTVRGNVRCNGPIYCQKGFVLEGSPRRLGNVSIAGTDSQGYREYRARWGATYSAQILGSGDESETLQLRNLVLAPSRTNPMGVFYFGGNELILDNGVTIAGTLAVRGHVTVRGRSISLSGLRYSKIRDDSTNHSSWLSSIFNSVISAIPLSTTFNDSDLDEDWVRTTFPAIVADRGIDIEATADDVQICGVALTQSTFRRQSSTSGSLECSHDHTLSLSEVNALSDSDGPAVYVQGAIMARRVRLEHCPERPFALVYSAEASNVRDAPGFFTWRVTEWTEAN
jgi:hypothetical protein